MRYGQPYWLTTKPRTAAPTVTKTRIVVKNELASRPRDSRPLRRPSHLSDLSTIDLRLNCISGGRRVSSAESKSQGRPICCIRETNYRDLLIRETCRQYVSPTREPSPPTRSCFRRCESRVTALYDHQSRAALACSFDR